MTGLTTVDICVLFETSRHPAVGHIGRTIDRARFPFVAAEQGSAATAHRGNGRHPVCPVVTTIAAAVTTLDARR